MIIRKLKEKKPGFTLIELLIVVAIIAILAAIAVPNFLEAQVRSKVARAKTDHRALATAIESYMVDHSEYPHQLNGIDNPIGLSRLSSPVAYIQNPTMKDPFKPPGDVSSNNNRDQNQYIYIDLKHKYNNGVGGMSSKFSRSTAFPLVNGHNVRDDYPGPLHWVLCSYGPDKVLQFDNFRSSFQATGVDNVYMPYDSTNGTRSSGDIFRFGP